MVSDSLLAVPLRRRALDALSAEARSSARLRKNWNVHAMADSVHRLFNAIEPGSYIRPHRHLHPPKAETLIVVSGALGLLSFDEVGRLVSTERMDARGETLGVDVPPGAWHTFVALEPGTVFFETKAGPYAAPSGIDAADWAPAEGAAEAAAQEARWRALFVRAEAPASRGLYRAE